MSESDAQMEGQDNSVGFPCCPKCGEVVSVEREVTSVGSPDIYYCGDCDYRFLLEAR